MKRCIKIIFEVDNAKKVLETFVLKNAEKFGVEGVGQEIKKGTVQLYVCAKDEQLDEFVDMLYLGHDDIILHNINIETCPTDRIYRNVFRIVE